MANNSPINPPISPVPLIQANPAPVVDIFSIPLEQLTPEQLQHRRNILEARKMERDELDRFTDTSQKEAARKANADNMVLVHLQEVANQNGCTHIKPRGMGSALAGQKTHRGWYTMVCQYCGKNFSDPPQKPEERIPAHLMPEMAMVGGPH